MNANLEESITNAMDESLNAAITEPEWDRIHDLALQLADFAYSKSSYVVSDSKISLLDEEMIRRMVDEVQMKSEIGKKRAFRYDPSLPILTTTYEQQQMMNAGNWPVENDPLKMN